MIDLFNTAVILPVKEPTRHKWYLSLVGDILICIKKFSIFAVSLNFIDPQLTLVLMASLCIIWSKYG